MEPYSNYFQQIIKSLEPGQFRTVHLGDSVESVRAKEADHELTEGNVYMPYIGYFIKVSPPSDQYFEVTYMYEDGVIDHIKFIFEFREYSNGMSPADFSQIHDDFVNYFNATYSNAVESGKNSLGNRGREKYQVWQSSGEHPLNITMVEQFKPKEKEATYLQIIFAKIV